MPDPGAQIEALLGCPTVHITSLVWGFFFGASAMLLAGALQHYLSWRARVDRHEP